MKDDTLLRRLEGIERLSAIGNTYYRGCYNLVAAIEFEGPLTEKLIQSALIQMQQKYECLNVEIVKEPGHEYHWVFKHTSEVIKLEVVESKPWREVWNELTASQINGLVWRMIWVRQKDDTKSHILTVFHHAIIDGASLRILFATLMQSIHQVYEGINKPTIIQPIHPPIHRLVNAKYPLMTFGRLGFYRYLRRLRTIPFDSLGELPESRRWHSTFKTLENDAVEKFLKRCRQESVKVGNAFSASLLLEVANYIRKFDSKPFDLALSMPIDLRHSLKESSPFSLLGALFSPIFLFFRPNLNQSLWELARKIEVKLLRSLFFREHINLSSLQVLIGPKTAAWIASKNQGRAAEGAFYVNNIGRLNETEFGPFKATAAYATASQALWGCTLFLGFVTIGGRLCITLGYPFPSVSDVTADHILDGIVHRLFS